MPLDVFFGSASRPLVTGLAIMSIVVVGLVDRSTGTDVSLAPFYLMPVLLMAWNVGRGAGLVVAALSTVSKTWADWPADSHGLVPLWNAVVWFAVFGFVVWLLSRLKEAVARQDQRLEAEAEATDELRAQNDLKNTLLHAVSHDLKGPLAGILGAMQTIRRAEQLSLTDTEMKDLYGVIEQAGAKAARLVDDLLDLDRLGRGQLQPEREPTDVADLARRLTTEVPALAGHPVRVEGDRHPVYLDTAKVERIVENLLGNAGKHTAPGTPIHVKVMGRPNGVVLIIEDEGEGVPDEIKETIFEPFQQGEDARGGVGIGLSLVRRFAELHGGTAHVEDRPGGGARFVVTLPGDLVEPPAAAAGLRAV
jgi:signal transduction histidine kinase